MTDQEERRIIDYLVDHGCFDEGGCQMDAIECACREFHLTEEEIGRIYIAQGRKEVQPNEGGSNG